jgi:5-methylcytosine-specific restriction endonuclease McrA
MKRCAHPGCKKPRAYAGTNEYGAFYRKKCDKHYQEELAEKRGFESYSDYQRSIHPYLRYRKQYCENKDGRLGFKCTTTLYWQGMLDVDHIDGNHLNNKPKNLQTLCKCCHSYKTNVNEDYKTPGRKTRKKNR